MHAFNIEPEIAAASVANLEPLSRHKLKSVEQAGIPEKHEECRLPEVNLLEKARMPGQSLRGRRGLRRASSIF